MAGRAIVVRRASIPEGYLLAQVLASLSTDSDVMEKVRQSIVGLLGHQLRSIGGNPTNVDDVRRAEELTVKLLNLGLETAARYRSDIDFALARNIIANRPLSLVYQAGQLLFEQYRHRANVAMQRSQVEFRGRWFRLVDAKTFKQMELLTDLDRLNGTVAQYRVAKEALTSAKRQLRLVPYLPISCEGLAFCERWGSTTRGKYPIESGVIDCFLFSLIIACLFRSKQELFARRDILQAKALILAQARRAADGGRYDDAERYVQGVISATRSIDFDQVSRHGDLSEQRVFLRAILSVSPDEIKKFTDLLFFEPQEFGKQAMVIEKRCREYLDVVEKSLRLKAPPKHHELAIRWALKEAAQSIVQQVRDFYRDLKDADPTSAEVVAFWDQRVCLQQGYKLAGFREEAAMHPRDFIDPVGLAAASAVRIAEGVRSFPSWRESDQELFLQYFNPNTVLKEQGVAGGLLAILRSLSSTEPSSVSDDRVAQVMEKIAWTTCHPGLIAELWRDGSPLVREIIFAHRHELKISPRSSWFFVLEDPDQRLFESLLERLTNENRLKPDSKIWDQLRRMAASMPRSLSVIIRQHKKSERQ